MLAGTSVVVPLSTGIIAAHAVPRWRPLVVDRAARRAIPLGRRRACLCGVGRSDPCARCRHRPRGVARPDWRQAHPLHLWRAGWVIAAAGGEAHRHSCLGRNRDVAEAARPGRVPAVARRRTARRFDRRRSVAALDVRDGSPRWTRRLGATPGEPLAIGGRVYVGTKDRYFYRTALVVQAHRGSPESRGGTARAGRGDRPARASPPWTIRSTPCCGATVRFAGTGVLYRPGAGPVVLGDFVIVPGYVEAPLPAFSATTGAAAGTVSFGGLLVALPLFATASGWPRGGHRDHRRAREQVDGDAAGAVGRPPIRFSRLRCCRVWWWRSCRLDSARLSRACSSRTAAASRVTPSRIRSGAGDENESR